MKSQSNPLTEALLDLGLLEFEDSIIIEKKDNPMERKIHPTRYGEFNYEMLREIFGLPAIEK